MLSTIFKETADSIVTELETSKEIILTNFSVHVRSTVLKS